jgi:hypothetical protein
MSPQALPAASLSNPCRRGSPVHFLPVGTSGGGSRRRRALFRDGLIVGAALLALAVAAWALPARAHSWYDAGCCHDRDCAPAPKGAVTRAPGGWHVQMNPWETPASIAVDQFLPDSFGQFHKSQDENFHVCVGIATTSKGPLGFVRCLYLPEYGS